MTDISHYVGVSTNMLAGVDIWRGAELTREYGLTCFEIHLGDFEAAVGDPWMIPHAGVWPRTFSRADRERLREELAHIRNLTIHGTPVDLNIAALNPGIRDESKRQYKEGLKLAVDLGAKWMTYHPGRATNSVAPPSYVEDRNVEFITEILDTAGDSGVKLAYECFNVNYLERIPDPQFGLLLDMGHAVMHGNRFAPEGRGDTQTIVDWIEHLGDRLIECHIHNVVNWSENPAMGTAHRAFDYGLCLDLERIVQRLREHALVVPLIAEIYEATAERSVQTLVETKTRIVDCWNADG